MMKKSIPILVLGCIMALMLFLVACGGQVTLTTTVTSTTTTPTTTTMTVTTTSTTTVTSTTTITPTTPENPFHGSISGNWTGSTIASERLDGTFSVTIDEEGHVTGTFDGTYTGTITGTVDACGNLNAIGTAVINGVSQQLTWLGTATLTQTTTGVEGTWSTSGANGTFIGTGETA